MVSAIEKIVGLAYSLLDDWRWRRIQLHFRILQIFLQISVKDGEKA